MFSINRELSVIQARAHFYLLVGRRPPYKTFTVLNIVPYFLAVFFLLFLKSIFEAGHIDDEMSGFYQRFIRLIYKIIIHFLLLLSNLHIALVNILKSLV